jgi:hypothetical protein
VTRTTPPPADDVAALFPGIEKYAATATRLHPRRGTPDGRGSHVGGPLRWPAAEPWPICSTPHLVPTEVPLPQPTLTRIRSAVAARDWSAYQSVISELATQLPGFAGVNRRTGAALAQLTRSAPTSLVPIAQLRVAEVPDLVAPPGADLLQVLWCPNDHDLDGATAGPAVEVRWRRAGDVPAVLDRPPAPATVGEAAYLPRPCVLHPEQVVEYPWWQDLPLQLGYQVHAWDREHGGRYHRELATAPGWKVGGWPSWPTSDPVPMYCPLCGAALRLLLQLDSGEWGAPRRWRPLEDGDDGAEPTGVVVGRTGLYRLFHCFFCPDAPIRVDVQ